ncbi:MAG: T9SS type A sorting domain-containing protein [Bacteroidetes bacterium]|jgi:hypothetical protein|nr:T9SS type A sorting domain-containing protein [Bacteroidota bacterium]MCC7513911.1 T9SS type A sorting domain-containing protein [Bacteroidia bacterium]HMW10993.1 T9SS type A sorting domain-containing protein [Bacteroidia bacterium]HMY14528.1 T9SS type A sorting domain-containing protein [Bacteroidia bacterium]HMY64907.1 T9SS type A sorting domain-containing protein [Bacteroidia bacterium]
MKNKIIQQKTITLKISLVFTLLFFFFQVNAQLECFTPDNPPSNMVSQPPSCTNYVNYEPDPTNNYQNTPVITFKINFHFFRKTSGWGIIQPSPAWTSQMQAFVATMSSMYQNIGPPTLPVAPPAQNINDSRIRFELKGIYFHDNDNYYYGTEWCGSSYYNAWGINKCNEINVFWYYTGGGHGGCGPYGYVNFRMDSLSNPANTFTWAWAQVLAHELGHSAGGLSHTYGGCNQFGCCTAFPACVPCGDDQFTDTYAPDCNLAWTGCSTNFIGSNNCAGCTYQVSNNIMGYNICRNYLSPMQMGYFHMNANTANPSYNTTRFLTYCDYDPANSITVNSSQTWTTSKAVGGDITITSGNTLTIQCSVFMPAGGKIYVQPNAHLIVDGGKISNACCSMWDGIVVYGPNGSLLTQNGAIIENAVLATSTPNGGIIQIDVNTHYTENATHVDIEGVTSSAYSGYIRGSLFDCPSAIQNPNYGSTTGSAIMVKNNTGNVTIGDDANIAFKNTIKDFTLAGVRIQDSKTTVINNFINSNNISTASRGIYATGVNGNAYELNIGTKMGYSSTLYSANQFVNLWMGIYIYKNFSPRIADNDFQSIRIRGIFIRDCLRNIDLLSLQSPSGNYIHNSPNIHEGIFILYNPRATQIRVLQNKLDLHNNAVAIRDLEYSCTDIHRLFIRGNEVNDTKYAIWVQNEGFPTIDNNRITFFTNPSNNQVGYGVYTLNSCFPDITNNIVVSLSNPKPVYGICAEMCNSPYICGNYVNALERGILCRGKMIGAKVKLNIMDGNYYGFYLENGGDIGEQGNSLLGDVSDNQWTNNLYFDTYAAGFSNINGATFFDVQSPGPPYSIITHANDGTTLFDVVSNILNPFNPADCNDHKGWRVIEDTEAGITDTIHDSLLTDEERWIKQRQMYNVASSANIITAPTSVIQDFIQDAQGHPVADFKDIDKYISKAFLDTIINDPDTIQIDSAKTRNLAVTDTKLIEFYSKIINDIYLSTVARGNYDFTQDQLDWIYSIAALCPFEAGPAVYRARLLASLVDDQQWFYDDICDPNSYLRKANQHPETSVQSQYFNLYPNPANSQLYLDYFLPENKSATISITDISGKELTKSNLKQYYNHLILPCDKFNAGIYFYKISVNDSVTKSGKVSIIH